MTLEEMSKAARELANAIFNTEEALCSQREQCLIKEEARPLTKAEKAFGWTRRPFNAFEADRMCAGCRAYFFAEMAAQQLHEMHCWQRRAAAHNRA